MDIGGKDNPSLEAHAGISDGTESEVEIKPDLGKLRVYKQTKLALVDQLRIVRESLNALGRENGERQCRELVVKLAEDRFTLAVLGQFKRGKSSLMNAVIGRELLPTGVLPLTSTITVLKYGPVERLVIHSEDSIFPKELPVSALADYVTEGNNPANRKKVKTAYVELPVQFLRSGIEFVDTPGVGSAITANTATTYGFLPECDAVLFVTSVDTPMTSLELAFLKEIREYVDKIFFVVNKIDLMDGNERNEVLRFITDTIQSQIGTGTIKVFPVSARMGLTARISSNLVLYEQSGLKALEEALASFLSEEKSAVFLATVAHKALRILDDEAAQDTFVETTLKAHTKATQKEGFDTIRRDPHNIIIAVTEAHTKLEALHANILNGRMADVVETEAPSSIVTENGSANTTIVATAKPAYPEGRSFIDIAVDLRTKGCPVCQHMTKLVLDFFANWQYQISTEERAQVEFALELGFCPLHTWQLLAMSSPYGASVGYARLTEQIAIRLREKTTVPTTGDSVLHLVHDSRNCRVCELLRQAEREYIQLLATMINKSAGRSQYRSSQGVCLRHLGMLIDATSTVESHVFLLSHAAQHFEEDAEDMRSYAMKHDAIRRALQNLNEEDAYRRAIIHIVGGRSVCMPWEEDGEI